MHEVFEVVAFIADLCFIFFEVMPKISDMIEAKKNAKPSVPPDGFDTVCDSSESRPTE